MVSISVCIEGQSEGLMEEKSGEKSWSQGYKESSMIH